MTAHTADLWADTANLPIHGFAQGGAGAYRIVSVRLREAEFETFTAQARGLGLTHNRALRIAARRIAGFLEIDSETRALLRQISGDIGDISLLIGRLSREAAGGGAADMTALMECRVRFSREFTVLDNKLQTILNVSRRRLDGRVMLQEAMSE